MKHYIGSQPEFDLFVNEDGIYTAEFPGGDYVCLQAEDADDATVLAMEYYEEVVLPNEQNS